MPLSSQVLATELKKIMDKDFPGFLGFPQTSIQSAENFSNAIGIYASSIAPFSSTNQQARLAYKSVMSAVNPNVPNGLALFQSAFLAFATSLAAGMAGFVSVPPPVPLILDPVFVIGMAGGSGSQCAETMAGIIDIWFRTGIATPPSGSPIPWN